MYYAVIKKNIHNTFNILYIYAHNGSVQNDIKFFYSLYLINES